VSIVPLRFGAGFKGKLAASLAHGVPSVATPVGVEGAGLDGLADVLVAEGATGFAAAVAYAYSEEAVWGRLAEAGLRFVREELSPERGAAHLREVLGKVGGRKGEGQYVVELRGAQG
jgi:glycosyltransferase involved in cell wall biosynthesis